MTKERFYEIDLLRFLAALSVVLFHYTFRGFAADDMSPLEFPHLAHVFKYGALGVDLFFIISGFVILLTALNRDAVSFTISRMTRIYPAYWFSVTLTAIVVIFFGGNIFSVDLPQYLANLTMLHGYFGVKHVDSVYWSLLVELKFYFLIFVLIVFKQIKNIIYFLYVWLAISLIHHFHPLSGALVFFLFPEWATYFIAGAAFYLIRLEGHSFSKYAIIVPSYILACMNAIDGIPQASAHFDTDFSPTVIVSIISSFYFIFFLIAARKTNMINVSFFSLLGALTYPLYLVHQNIGFIIFNHFDSESFKYPVLTLTILLSLALSVLINKYIERKYSIPLKKLLTKAFTPVAFFVRDKA